MASYTSTRRGMLAAMAIAPAAIVAPAAAAPVCGDIGHA